MIMESIRTVMEWAAFVLEIAAVVVIVGGAVIATTRCGLIKVMLNLDKPDLVSPYKRQLVGSLLLGLDLLVASDVIKTAALEFSLYNVATLGLLVIVRITLTWSLVVEAEGRWPWQALSENDEDNTVDG
jgi:uncharacterized membrane protein